MPDSRLWIEALDRGEESPWVCGRVGAKPFRATLSWLLTDHHGTDCNLLRLARGYYEPDTAPVRRQASEGDGLHATTDLLHDILGEQHGIGESASG